LWGIRLERICKETSTPLPGKCIMAGFRVGFSQDRIERICRDSLSDDPGLCIYSGIRAGFDANRIERLALLNILFAQYTSKPRVSISKTESLIY